MRISEDFLIESRSARSQGLTELIRQSRGEDILNKVKSLLFAVWGGTPRCTRRQLADFYEVPVKTIDKNRERFADEFLQDGVETLRGQGLQDARDILSLASRSSQESIYTPAAALRMGFILRDSEVAKAVRTVAIKVIQGVEAKPNGQSALQSLKVADPQMMELLSGGKLRVSAPLASFHGKYKRQIASKYPNGKSLGLSVDMVRRELVVLASFTDHWGLHSEKELTQHFESRPLRSYPHLTSQVFKASAGGVETSAVFVFQVFDRFVDKDDIANVYAARDYLQAARESTGADLAFLFCVSPLGATPIAQEYIATCLRPEDQGCVGVLTVKELAEFLDQQVRLSKSHPLQQFSPRGSNRAPGKVDPQLFNYSIPTIDDIAPIRQPALFEV